MDIRKIKKLIELVEESGIAELEISLQVTKFFLQWLVLSTALQVLMRNHS